jgi:hypothetical protein
VKVGLGALCPRGLWPVRSTQCIPLLQGDKEGNRFFSRRTKLECDICKQCAVSARRPCRRGSEAAELINSVSLTAMIGVMRKCDDAQTRPGLVNECLQGDKRVVNLKIQETLHRALWSQVKGATRFMLAASVAAIKPATRPIHALGEAVRFSGGRFPTCRCVRGQVGNLPPQRTDNFNRRGYGALYQPRKCFS